MHTTFAKCLLVDAQDPILIMWPLPNWFCEQNNELLKKKEITFLLELYHHTCSMALKDVANIAHVHQLIS
jgi:hypothetical protein